MTDPTERREAEPGLTRRQRDRLAALKRRERSLAQQLGGVRRRIAELEARS